MSLPKASIDAARKNPAATATFLSIAIYMTALAVYIDRMMNHRSTAGAESVFNGACEIGDTLFRSIIMSLLSISAVYGSARMVMNFAGFLNTRKPVDPAQAGLLESNNNLVAATT